jgi:hypothetical protein
MHVYECASIPYMCAELLISVLAWNTQHYAERWTRAHGASKSCSGADPQIPQRCRELDHFCCDRGEGASSQHPCNFLGPISVVGYMLNSTTVQHPRLGIDASRWAACDRGIVRGACQHRPWCRTAHGIAEHMGILCHKKKVRDMCAETETNSTQGYSRYGQALQVEPRMVGRDPIKENQKRTRPAHFVRVHSKVSRHW